MGRIVSEPPVCTAFVLEKRGVCSYVEYSQSYKQTLILAASLGSYWACIGSRLRRSSPS